MASSVPVVDIPDDDDDDDDENGLAVASPPSSKRSHGSSRATTTSRADFLDAFSPPPAQQKQRPAEGPISLDELLELASPPSGKRSAGSSGGVSSRDFLDAFSPCPRRDKRPLPAAGADGPIDLDEDDTPSPPKRRRSSSVSVDLDDTPSPPKPPRSSVSVDLDDTPSPPKPPRSSVSVDLDDTPSPPKPRRVSSVSVDLDDTPSPPKPRPSSVPTLPVLVADEEEPVAPSPPVPVSPTGASHSQEQVPAKQKRQPAGKKLTKEERDKLRQERKQKREEDKLLKQALKDERAKKAQMEKALKQWESGKLALQCMTVEIDNSVIQRGSIGGRLLSSLTENGLSYEPTKNKISGSVLWKLNVPDNISQAFSDSDMSQHQLSQVKYIAILFEAEEFCNLISNGSFFNHVQRVRDEYPGFTICYIINKLMNYVKKRDDSQYRNPSNTWKRPPVEEVLCKLATHYTNVHSRQCLDEDQVVEHLVGLTSSLAKCKFRKPLTWLSVHANGAVVPDHFVHKNLAKNNTWLKALIAIPDIQSRHAMAIWKKYPCMKSLLNEYMDASKTVSEKERLLSDLKSEDRLGDARIRLGDKCSRRVYRMLMAQNGDLDTDDPEAGGKA